MSAFAKLPAQHKQLVTKLQEVIGNVASRNDLIELLSVCNWDVAQAAEQFFSGAWAPQARGSAPAEAAPAAIDEAKVVAWFQKYADADSPDTMHVEGIGAFCDDLQVNPEDIVLLVISYHFGAENMLVYTKEEFVRGMRSMQVESVTELREKLPELRKQLDDEEEHKQIYTWCFKWACPPGQKSLPVETAVALWQLLLEGKFALLAEWCAYINAERTHAVSRDEWQLLLDFAATVDAELNGYDENSAWPVVMDTFVEHMEEKLKATKSS